jgi:hypothetical protein
MYPIRIPITLARLKLGRVLIQLGAGLIEAGTLAYLCGDFQGAGLDRCRVLATRPTC